MKNDERLLREYIRNSLRQQLLSEEDNGSVTVGDIKSALEYAKGKNLKSAFAAASKEAGKKGAKLGLNFLLSLLPGASAVSSAIEAGLEFKELANAAKSVSPEAKKTNPAWDLLTIDPDKSAIVDDAIEADFFKAISDKIKNLDDDDVLPDMDVQLNSYLRNRFNNTAITKKT